MPRPLHKYVRVSHVLSILVRYCNESLPQGERLAAGAVVHRGDIVAENARFLARCNDTGSMYESGRWLTNESLPQGERLADPMSGWATMAAEELEPFGRWRHAEEKPCNRISMLRVCADVGACGLRRVVVGQRVVCVCYGIDRIRQLERG